MDWNIGWSVLAGILSSSLVSTLVLAVLGHSLSKRLEAFKKDLSLELFESQTKFAWLHSERSRVLVRLYRLLWKVDDSFRDMTRPVQFTNDERRSMNREKVSAAATGFFEFYQKNRVLLDNDLLKSLERIQEEYMRIWSEFVPFDDSWPDPKSWAEAWKKVGETGATFAEIKQQVQHMLGVDTAFRKGNA